MLSPRARWTVRIIGVAAAGGGGPDRVARAVGDAARPGPGQPGATGLHPPRRGLGGPLPGLRSGRCGQPALPVAPHPVAVLGPPGRRRRRGRGGLQHLHADLRVRSGASPPGVSTGPGTPASPARRCCWSSSSGTSPCVGSRPSPRCGPNAAPSWPCSPRSTSPSSTSRCCGGTPSTRGPPCSTPNLSPTIHGSMAWTLLLSFIALTLVFVWMLLVRYRIGVLRGLAGQRRAGRGPTRAPGRRAGGRPARGGLMGYVQAGYSIVLAILFLYALSLPGRRRRLNRAVARLVAAAGRASGRGHPARPRPVASRPHRPARRAVRRSPGRRRWGPAPIPGRSRDHRPAAPAGDRQPVRRRPASSGRRRPAGGPPGRQPPAALRRGGRRAGGRLRLPGGQGPRLGPRTSICRPTRPSPRRPPSGGKTFNLEGRGRAGSVHATRGRCGLRRHLGVRPGCRSTTRAGRPSSSRPTSR